MMKDKDGNVMRDEESVLSVNNYYDRLYHTSCRYHTSCFIYIYLHSHSQAGTAHTYA